MDSDRIIVCDAIGVHISQLIAQGATSVAPSFSSKKIIISLSGKQTIIFSKLYWAYQQ
jgi:hypothetical protein